MKAIPEQQITTDPRGQYATIKQTWQHVFPERMKSAGSIHVPMSEGIFQPEIHRAPPEPCELSPADLVTIAAENLLCGLGMRHDDFKGPLQFWTFGQFMPDLSEQDDHQCAAISARDQYALHLVLDGLTQEQQRKIFPRGQMNGVYFLGPDRVLQRLLEERDFGVDIVVCHQSTHNDKGGLVANVWIYPENDRGWANFIEYDRFGGAYTDKDSRPKAKNWQGIHRFQAYSIYQHVMERLHSLND